MGSILFRRMSARVQIKESSVVENDTTGEITPEVSPEEYIGSLKKALEEEKAKAETNLAGWQRAQADFVNYKRYVEQDKLETSKYMAGNTLLTILPVLDDLERAMASIPHEDAKKKWLEGFKLIEKKFRSILEKQGLTAIKSMGEDFDCRSMDAITCAPGKKDVVIQELEKGYKLNDKVIRPAKVIVGGGEEAVKED
jgi:molecular chaperone GrpE